MPVPCQVVPTFVTCTAVLLLASLVVYRRRRLCSQPSLWPDESSFEAAARAAAPPLQDVYLATCAHSTYNLWQGKFQLVTNDLMLGLGSAATSSLSVLEAAGVADMYELRTEVVNLKKTCLRVFHDAERVMLDLTRIDAFFWRDTTQPAGLMQSRQRAKGLVLAIHDARDFTKMLCSVPRHPESDGCHKRLLDMPRSFKTSSAIGRAENFLVLAGDAAPALADDHVPLPTSFLSSGLDLVMVEHERAHPNWPAFVHRYVRLSLIARGACKALAICEGLSLWQLALQRAHDRTLRTLDGLSRRAAAITDLLGRDRSGDLMDGLTKSEVDLLIGRAKLCERHRHELEGIAEANRHLLKAVEQLTCIFDWRRQGHSATRASAAGCGESKRLSKPRERRLYVANDDMGSSMFYPAAFKPIGDLVGELACEARKLDANVLEVTRLRSVDGGLGRVSGGAEWFEQGAHHSMSYVTSERCGVEGKLRCWRCEHSFSKLWMAQGVCWQCEGVVRAKGSCPHDERVTGPETVVAMGGSGGEDARPRGGGRSMAVRGGRPATHQGSTFCSHQNKCVVCDGGFAPCSKCNLARGDGEDVSTLCAGWPSDLILFFDFDRSLCSTKSGGESALCASALLALTSP